MAWGAGARPGGEGGSAGSETGTAEVGGTAESAVFVPTLVWGSFRVSWGAPEARPASRALPGSPGRLSRPPRPPVWSVWAPGRCAARFGVQTWQTRWKTRQQSVPTPHPQSTAGDTEAEKGAERAPSASCGVPG